MDLSSFYEFDQDLIELAEEVEKEIEMQIKKVSDIVRYNTCKVLKAFEDASFNEAHLNGTTGYGYDDISREKIEDVYKKAFNAESALVRIQIVSGTHALSLALFGILRPGDLLVSLTGKPYDTMDAVIGYNRESEGSLKEFGIKYEEISMDSNGHPDYDKIRKFIREKRPKMTLIQRSRGYDLRDSLDIDTIREVVECVKKECIETIVMVDNCYGEFTDYFEPTDVGCDIMAGSLIKNPGGGISPSGGYVAGKSNLVELAAQRLTAPGLGSHCGPTFGFSLDIAKGFYFAPMVVGEAMSGSIFASRFLSRLGYNVNPVYTQKRNDIVLRVDLNDPEVLLEFTKAVQKTSPVNSAFTPMPAPMPGYGDDIVMAAGTFTQGSSIEMSADAPMRPPYTVFLQGGLNRYQVYLAMMRFAQSTKKKRK